VGEVKTLRAAAELAAEPYDVVIEGDSSGEFIRLDPPEPDAWAAAGATWWIESWWTVEPGPAGLAEVRRRIQAGPPGQARACPTAGSDVEPIDAFKSRNGTGAASVATRPIDNGTSAACGRGRPDPGHHAC
jgi:hypothetical protein